jgi:hypothetical protein
VKETRTHEEVAVDTDGEENFYMSSGYRMKNEWTYRNQHTKTGGRKAIPGPRRGINR